MTNNTENADIKNINVSIAKSGNDKKERMGKFVVRFFSEKGK